jgi:DNA polymerase-3 subunit gamma/tau
LVYGVEKLSSSGRDILRFASDLVMYFRNLLMCKLSNKPNDILDVSKQYLDRMMLQAEAFSKDQIIGIIKELSSFEPQLKYALNQRVFLEVMLISISIGNYGQSTDNSDLVDRISDLENKIRNGAFLSNSVSSANPENQKGYGGNSFDTVKLNQSGNSELSDTGTKPKSKSANYSELEVWADVMSELKSRGRMRLVTYLAETKAVAADESTVMVVFPENVCSLKSCVTKPEDTQILEEILSQKLSQNIRVKIVDEETLESLAPFKASTKKDTQKNELIEFSGSKLNEHLDIIDE